MKLDTTDQVERFKDFISSNFKRYDNNYISQILYVRDSGFKEKPKVN